jgi:hypothetical protein
MNPLVGGRVKPSRSLSDGKAQVRTSTIKEAADVADTSKLKSYNPLIVDSLVLLLLRFQTEVWPKRWGNNISAI